MSLETVIEENNNLLRELIAMWKTGATPVPSPAPAAPAASPATGKDKTPKVDPKATTETPAADTAKGTTEAAVEVEVTYEQIKPLIIKYNQVKGRDAATALLGEFGVARGPDLKPEQFAKFLARVQELLA